MKDEYENLKSVAYGDAGQIVSPHLHDARIYRIDFNGKSPAFYFESEEGDKFKLMLVGVEYLLCNQFSAGNIVLDITVEQGEEVDLDLIRCLFSEETAAQKKFVEKITQKIKDGELKLFTLSPSYGGEVTALCNDLYYSEIGIL